MREIKFRSWSKRYQKMIQVVSIDFIKDELTGYFTDSAELMHQPIPLQKGVLMQFTGLKDKNGKEIYEGDIINYKGVCSAPNGSFGKEFKEKITVEFYRGYFRPFNIPFSNSEESEIIGNIYENPELLKQEVK